MLGGYPREDFCSLRRDRRDDLTLAYMALAKQSQPPRNGKRVLLVDDHAVVRYGMAQLIGREQDLSVCGEEEDASKALGAIDRLKPDLVIADISLKDSSGLGVDAEHQGAVSEAAGAGGQRPRRIGVCRGGVSGGRHGLPDEGGARSRRSFRPSAGCSAATFTSAMRWGPGCSSNRSAARPTSSNRPSRA